MRNGVNTGHGMLDMFDEGPCCDVPACPVRTLWPIDGESQAAFIARLKHEHRRAPSPQEASA